MSIDTASGRTYSDAWHRVAGVRASLRSSVRAHRQRFRGQDWVVLRDSLATEGASNERYRQMLDLQRQSHLPAIGPMTVENSLTLPALPERKP